MTTIELEVFDNAIKFLARQYEDELRMQVNSASIARAVSISIRNDRRIAGQKHISVKLPRFAVFREVGAGSGIGAEKGSKWEKWNEGRKTIIKTNPLSLGKVGTGATSRQILNTFNNVIREFTEELADLATQHYAKLTGNMEVQPKNSRLTFTPQM